MDTRERFSLSALEKKAAFVNTGDSVLQDMDREKPES